MLEDTFEGMEDGEEMEEAAEAEVDKILFEITAGKVPVFWILTFALSFTKSDSSKGQHMVKVQI